MIFLDFFTQLGRFRLPVEVMSTKAQRERGYSFRRTVRADHGMLFVFDYMKSLEFQMRDTYVSLDMVFIDDHGVVSGVIYGATPRSSTVYLGAGKYVVEVPSPWARQHIVKAGARVRTA